MEFLLLDVGSSFIKYSFYDNGKRANSEICAVPFPKPLVDDGVRYEVDRALLDEAFFRIVDEAAERECAAAFISVQMHGYLLKHGGEFSNYISWKDRRGLAVAEGSEKRDLYENGTVMKANLPRASLMTYPALAGREFFTLGSYLAYLLTGRNITHITDACAGGLFLADSGAADSPFEGLALPVAAREIAPCGSYKGMAIYPPMGDHQVSFLGAGALEGEAVLNIGTAAQLSALTDTGDTHLDGVEYRPYFVKGRRVVTLSGLSGRDTAAMVSRIREMAEAYRGVRRILFGGGGAEDNYALLVAELSALGYEAELCSQNLGNEGLKRIADGAYPRRGTMLSEVEFVNFPFVMKTAGLDFFIIDNEHGSFENKTVTALAMNARAAEMQAIVRLPNNDRAMITKLADGGVSGFLLPMTNKKEDIERVVEYAKYAPDGKRGISTTRAHTGYGVADLTEYMRTANRRMKLYAQIETRAGVENALKIASVPEVEGIFIGPNDLSCDYGCMGDNETIKRLISVICRACLTVGKPCGIITTDKDLIRHALLSGCSMVSYGSEINMLKKGAKDIRNAEFL